METTMPETTDKPRVLRHLGLAGYLKRNRFEAGDERGDGALVLVFDNQYRVHFHPARHGDVAMEARLKVLPVSRGEADALLRETLELATGRLAESADTVVLAGDERTLVLQQRVSVDATVPEFEQALEDFINAVASWRRSLYVL
jgi:hypothetical protein